MKKAFTLFLLASSFGWLSSQNATNFSANDCAGNPHVLFSELDQGKVVVMTWVMPCGSCITPTITAYNAVNNHLNPNVLFYLVDDYGNTNCSSLNSWAASYAVVPDAVFSNSNIDMLDYGAAGMPKTVVLGGGQCHSVYFNVNGSVDSGALTAAIDNALSPCLATDPGSVPGFSVSPNPNSGILRIESPFSGETSFQVTNSWGQALRSGVLNSSSLDLSDLPTGLYFLTLRAGDQTVAQPIQITH